MPPNGDISMRYPGTSHMLTVPTFWVTPAGGSNAKNEPLLFLLATLGGLYRYNLRLAGFHHSRADALVLLAEYQEMMEKPIGEDKVPLFVEMASLLAADKVEFGKGNVPSDQALEMFKAMAARVK